MAGVDVLAFHVEWDRRRVDIPHGEQQSVGMILQVHAIAGDCGRPRGGIALGGVQRVKDKLSTILVQHE